MQQFTRGALTAVAAGGLAIGLIPSAAEATPGSGVTGTILSQTRIGRTDYVLPEITIQPGVRRAGTSTTARCTRS